MALVTGSWTTATSESITRADVARLEEVPTTTNCNLCGIRFTYFARAVGRKRSFCSEACGNENYRKNIVTKEMRRKWREQEKKPKPEKPVLTQECPICGTVFTYRLANIPRKYCSSKCKDRNGKFSALERNYGLSKAEWEHINREQRGRCAICGNSEKRLHLDHNHLTGAVRGLLCNRCNLGIGHFADDYARLLKAADYVETGGVVKRWH